MNPFKNMTKVGFSRKSNNFVNDGTYIGEIADVKKRVSTHPAKMGQISIIIEINILEVLVNKGEYTSPAGETKRSNQAGETVTVFIPMSWGEGAIKLLKMFLCAAAEISLEDAQQFDDTSWFEFVEKACFHLGDEVNDLVTDEWGEQPLKGKEIKIIGHTKLTNAGKDFTKVEFDQAV